MHLTNNRQSLSIQNIQCSYTKDGEGPPIILLHGWAQSSLTWQSLTPFLRHHFSLYAVDAPGFGLSDAPAGEWTIRDYAEFVHIFAEKVALAKPCIIGHSFGARVALEYASRFPTKKLIVIATSGERRTWFRYFNFILVHALKNIAPTFLYRAHSSFLTPKGFAETSRIDGARAHHMLQIYLKTHSKAPKTNFKEITCPTLLIYGENDVIAPVAAGISLQKEIVHSKLVSIPRAGHFPFVDASRDVADLLTRFLKSQ